MLYLEDVAEGQRFAAGPTAPIALSDISAFANRFDPQPFHVDPTAAKETFFGEIVASGWHTASLTMRLLTDAVPSANGLIGSAVEELQWPSPVRPGDSLRIECVVQAVRQSTSRPDRGYVRLGVETFTSGGSVVQRMTTTVLVFARSVRFGSRKEHM